MLPGHFSKWTCEIDSGCLDKPHHISGCCLSWGGRCSRMPRRWGTEEGRHGQMDEERAWGAILASIIVSFSLFFICLCLFFLSILFHFVSFSISFLLSFFLSLTLFLVLSILFFSQFLFLPSSLSLSCLHESSVTCSENASLLAGCFRKKRRHKSHSTLKSHTWAGRQVCLRCLQRHRRGLFFIYASVSLIHCYKQKFQSSPANCCGTVYTWSV